MSFGDTLRNLIDKMLKNTIIISPRFSDYRVADILPIPDFGVDEHFRSEVVRIIKEEIQIEMTKVESGQGAEAIGSDALAAGTNLQSKIKSNLLKGVASTQDPIAAVTGALKGVPIPHAALVALSLALIPLIFKELTRDGGLLDLRWKRIIDDEVNGFLDRQTQRNTQIGTRQVIIQSRAGFIAINGAAGNENTIRQIRDGGVDGNRLAQIDITDHSKELFS